EDGLPGNSVFAIEQTRDGYLWLGIQGGLVRFDGLNFELFTTQSTPQLKDNSVRVLYEDRDGTLWIGTNYGGLTRVKGGEFFTYSITDYPALYKLRAIEEDRWGNLWIGSFGNGLTYLNNGKFTTYTTNEGLLNNQVRAIYKDTGSDLWVTTSGGVVKLIGPGNFQLFTGQDVLPLVKTACLYKESAGELWIGAGKRLAKFKNGKTVSYGADAGLPPHSINILFEDRMKNLWIGMDGGGLSRMSNGVLSTLPGGDGLADGFVYSIYEDREGSLWVGTVNGGLHQLRDCKFTNYTPREGLAHDYVHCVYESRNGDIWIGTRGGLNRLKKGKSTIELTIGNGLLDNNILCLFEDPAGYLWIGTWGGLHRFKDGKLTTFTRETGLSHNKVNGILDDGQGNTWIGTKNGLNRFDNKNGTFTVFTMKEGLLSNEVEFIFKDREGRLWIGTYAGLNRWNNGNFTAYIPPVEIGKSTFKCAYQDNEGVLWFGTNNGLIRLKEKDTTLYTIEDGLIENNVYTIFEDESGYLWLGSQNGISRVAKKELEEFSRGKIGRIQPDSYNEEDGMKSRWCSGIGCKTRDGRFWFPTTGGVAVIDPNHIKEDTIPPVPIIEELTVDGVAIETHANGKGKKHLELEPGKKRLEFHYRGVSFVNPGKMKFKIKLTGYDSDWVSMGTRRSTTYTRLSPGFYTFSVISCNSDGVWNEEGVSLSFHLLPFFYQTTWFYFLVTLAVLLAVFGGYRFRVRQLRAREKELSRLVELRTSDLKERNIELGNAQQKLRQSKEIIEEKNRNIMDSIRYARKIQEAMLPVKEKIEKYLEDSFVIYRPKDIVSGDFYWFDVIGDQYFLAVADCTGHGVPGALLSMIGNMMLNDVVIDKKIFDPAAALFHLHQGFRTVLKQELGETDTYDGMDVGLCRIDLGAGKITFAGAGRPLFYVRDAQLFEIKGNRKSIGGRQKEEKRFFTNHEIEIPGQNTDGIMLYLTTDGFTDQNNPRNQKYGSQRFKDFLRGHIHLSTVGQKEAFIEELKRHRSGEEQRDDIT
ncbi:MAG: SpoIIE family protein phosphatase, partial [bacterium]|nr:SpoIIE family protein phosphatase [bacterium]